MSLSDEELQRELQGSFNRMGNNLSGLLSLVCCCGGIVLLAVIIGML